MDGRMALALAVVGLPVGLLLLAWLSGLRYIPHHRVGIVEKLWSLSGSLGEGRIVSTDGRAGD